MANFTKFGPLVLFCSLAGKFLVLSGSLYDVLAIGVVGLLVALEKHYSHTEALSSFNKQMSELREEVKTIKEKQDSFNTSLTSVRLAQGFRPAGTNGNR